MRLKRPDLWFLVTLLLVTAVGAVVLTQSDAIRAESRRLSYDRHYWQAAFDALSAACGVGLLTYDFQEDYTPRGRWALTALGLLGAVLFLAAVTHALRRMQSAEGSEGPGARPTLPHPLFVVGAFLVTQALALGVFLLVIQFSSSETGASETAWRTIAAFSSLGWANEVGGDRLKAGLTVWPLALLAWLGALGWPVWLLLVRRLSRRFVQVRSALAILGGYVAFLLLAALLISAFESPRGSVQQPAVSGRQSETRSISAEPWSTRYARSLVQTVAASGAGMPTESLIGRDATAGTKVTLSAVLLMGGLGGSPTGGVQWPLLLWALIGGAAVLGWAGPLTPQSAAKGGRANRAPDVVRWMHAGLACLLLLITLALIVALGLLLIENRTASHADYPPSFADALLDACSAVAGGNLSGGLTEAVTSRNLIGGIRQSANLYQYGMLWLMLAMLVGRMLPLVILRRMADAQDYKPA